MTDDMMTLRTLLEKSSDADLLREMIGFTAQRLMELDIEGRTGAGHGERSHGSWLPTLPIPSRDRSRATGGSRPIPAAAATGPTVPS